jgi:hypothetical protein
MNVDKIVQFVSFETVLDTEQFIPRWQEFTRSANIDNDVIVQRSMNGKGFKYIAQHRCETGAPEFVFEKKRRSSRNPEIGITARLAGGYSVLQWTRKNDLTTNESKVFVFLTDPTANLNIYKQLFPNSQLNIYQAYFENCKYAYILEFLLKDKYVNELWELLVKNNVTEAGIYKKCAL